MQTSTFPLPSGWMNLPARAGTLVGNQLRQRLITDWLTLFPSTRRLYVPLLSDGASITEAARPAATLTAVGTPTYGALTGVTGTGAAATLDGSSQYYSLPDANDLSFGDGVNDSALALMGLWYQSVSTGAQDLVSKYDITTGATQKEYRLYLNAGKLTAECHDDSANTTIGRSYNTALATSTWTFGGMDYDGSRAATGIRLVAYNGTVNNQIDDTDGSSGAYVALENKTSLLYLGASKGAAAITGYFNGSLALAAVVAAQPTLDNWFAAKRLVNGFFGLSL